MADLVSLTDRIEDLDGFIKFTANSIMRHEGEFEDLVQAGMIAVWEARQQLEDKPDKVHKEAFYRTRIQWRVRDEARRMRREPVHESLDELQKNDMDYDDFV